MNVTGTTGGAGSQHWYALATVVHGRCRDTVIDGQTSSTATIKTVFHKGYVTQYPERAERDLALDLAGRRGRYRVEKDKDLLDGELGAGLARRTLFERVCAYL
ncbi:hypothetical protein QP868_11595 [Brevibacterium sp. UMB1308A]|uniref:hypothetical protein n=1 Tax=Brevibacterium sp. UMB1308A TaxID=3050608 RepID=UPI00254E5F2E|nr:hypothetical protein [Brevibacterium sp. UMB1308A]MDK8347634.1 hypothetical protein [Brevibacterium sp. UMB1308B]MDK8714535.1 hypothetical protein [Brevibacterium sp. UMB1308A]